MYIFCMIDWFCKVWRVHHCWWHTFWGNNSDHFHAPPSPHPPTPGKKQTNLPHKKQQQLITWKQKWNRCQYDYFSSVDNYTISPKSALSFQWLKKRKLRGFRGKSKNKHSRSIANSPPLWFPRHPPDLPPTPHPTGQQLKKLKNFTQSSVKVTDLHISGHMDPM